MEYDITTEEGMEMAKLWLNNFLSFGQNHFTWGIPRSQAIYHINKIDKTVRRTTPDPETDMVFKALGWKVEELK